MISAGIPGKHVIGYWAKRNNEQLLIESLEDLQKNDLILGAMTQVGRKANTEGNNDTNIFMKSIKYNFKRSKSIQSSHQRSQVRQQGPRCRLRVLSLDSQLSAVPILDGQVNWKMFQKDIKFKVLELKLRNEISSVVLTNSTRDARTEDLDMNLSFKT